MEHNRPWNLLPVPYPKDYDPSVENPNYFYENFCKPFTEDMVKLTSEGLCIDQKAVEDLRDTIDNVLQSVADRLSVNPLILQYQESMYPGLVAAHKAKALASVRRPEYYLKEYNTTNITHRTWVVNDFLVQNGKEGKVKDKWTITDVKSLNVFIKSSFLLQVVDKSLSVTNKYAVSGMHKLAEEQARLWNLPRIGKSNESIVVPKFNPGSSKQVQEFFEMLEIPPISVSKKTDNPSWSRGNIERLLSWTTDEDLLDILQAIIDHSFSKIIRDNFLAGFDSFTIDGVLYGNIKVFGAKSFRPTSNEPNLLNMPSSRSIYAKPLKKCFVPAKGRVIYAVDLGALEDRGIANLSGDTNKQNIFLENLDGHSLNACGYFSEEIAKYMGPNTDNVAYVKEFYKRVQDDDDPDAAALGNIRFISKEPTFKLAYGGFPDEHKGGVITKEIFDNYHNLLYPGITNYRENYVLPFIKEHGYIHLGLGCRMYSDSPDDNIRSINNATVQFWSILTLIAINEMNHRIVEAGYEDRITIISTIYDSIYLTVEEDAHLIKWLNDNIIPVLCVQWLEDEVVHNVATGEIGLNWSELFKVQNNASVEDISEVMEKMHE